MSDGSAIARAIDYSLTHWLGLGRFLLDGDVPIDNNHVENRVRPWALGRRNWLFIGVIVFLLQIDTLTQKNSNSDKHLQKRLWRTACAFGAD